MANESSRKLLDLARLNRLSLELQGAGCWALPDALDRLAREARAFLPDVCPNCKQSARDCWRTRCGEDELPVEDRRAA